MPDSLKQAVGTVPEKADSAAVPYYAPAFPSGLTDTMVLSGKKPVQISEYPEVVQGQGRMPEAYAVTPVRTSGALLLLVVSFLLVAFCYKNGRKYFSAVVAGIWSVKRVKNHLDDHTMSETLIMVALILQTVIMEGFIFYYALIRAVPPETGENTFLHVGLSVSAAGFYYLFQLMLLRALGYIFSGKAETNLWIKGFNASQSLMGLALAPVALFLLFVPGHDDLMLFLAVCLYTIARLAFLIKSFRIFFSKMFQCLYFILYLCAVEIVPLIFCYKGVLLIYNSLENCLL